MNAFEVVGKYVIDGAGKVSSQIDKITDRAEDSSKELDKLGRNVDDAGSELSSMSRQADRASDSLNDVDSSSDRASNGIGGFVDSIGDATIKATAFVAALGAIGGAGAEAMKELRIASQVSGATREEFQKAAFAASTMGIESEKLADIYKDVNDRVGDFLQTGGGPMKDFFENIAPQVGVTADAFRELSGPEALQLFYNSLEKAGLNAQEMTFHLEAMASDSARLVPLLEDGGKGFEKLGKEAEDSGAVISESYLRMVQDGERSFGKMTASFSSIVTYIGTALLPAFESIEPLITNIVLPVVKAFSTALVGLLSIFNLLPEPIRAVAAGFVAYKIAIVPVLALLGKMNIALPIFSTALAVASKAWKAFSLSLMMSNPILLAAAAVVAAIITVVSQWDEVVEGAKRLWNNFKMWIERLFMSMGINIVNNIENLPRELLNVFKRAGEGVMDWVRGFTDKIVKAFRNLLDKIPGINLKASTAGLAASMPSNPMSPYSQYSRRTIGGASSSVTNIDMRNSTFRNSADLNDRLIRSGSAPISGF